MLRFASREYVCLLHRGAAIEELSALGTLTYFILYVVATGLTLRARIPGYELAESLVGVSLASASLLGYWLLTATDPGFNDSTSIRLARMIRFALVLGLLFALARAGFAVYGVSYHRAIWGVAPNTMVAWAADSIWVGAAVAWLVQLVASMNYVAMLASRFPDQSIYTEARNFRWQGPLWFVPGVIFCFTGPIVAMVLYISMIDRVRMRLRWTLQEIDAAGVEIVH